MGYKNNKDDIGIYKITNNINGKSYIGQSNNIRRRWVSHIYASFKNSEIYNFPLYEDFRTYGLDNFSFERLERIEKYDLNLLLQRETYWIKKLNPEYNQTYGDNNNVTYSKLTEEDVKKIKKILLNIPEEELSNRDIAIKFNVIEDTIRNINTGRTWHDDKLSYPLRISKHDSRYFPKVEQKYCKKCGCEISRYAEYCSECYKEIQSHKSKINDISKEKLD